MPHNMSPDAEARVRNRARLAARRVLNNPAAGPADKARARRYL